MAYYIKQKVCEHCGEEYTAKCPVQKYCCKECREAANGIKHKKEQEAKPVSKFAPVVAFIKKHYEETGEWLTYGKAVVLMERKKKDAVD